MTEHDCTCHEMVMLPFVRLGRGPHLAAKGLADRGIETTSPGIAGDFNGEMKLEENHWPKMENMGEPWRTLPTKPRFSKFLKPD